MIECVPNVSEGRDSSAIAAMAAALRAEGARVLDVHSDSDHNRSVFTMAGTADALTRAVTRLAVEAASRIDLRLQRGVHPRIGALDVVPFVPLDGSTIDECIALARRVGEVIAREVGVPVFLYGLAATDPARVALAALRRGGLEGLGARIGSSGWVPDFGPRRLHPTAGAVAIGARSLLVAYNVCLATTNLVAGRLIARAVREANGGPRGVRALAFFLEKKGQVQISMNLTDVDATPVQRAFEVVAALARGYGIRVASSEIVGLAPRRALDGAAPSSLLLPGRLDDYALEARLEAE